MKKFCSFALVLFTSILFVSCIIHEGAVPMHNRDIRINIIESVNGTHVKGCRLNIYRRENNKLEKVLSDIEINDAVYCGLKAANKYDFELTCESGEFAGSYLRNFAVTEKTKVITIIQPKLFQKQREAAAPVLLNLRLKYRDEKGIQTEKEIADGLEIEAPLDGSIVADIAASSFMADGGFTNGFSVKIGLDSCPTFFYGMTPITKPIPGEVEKIKDGKWKGMYKYSFGFMFLKMNPGIKGSSVLVLTAYDTSGNRLESHHHVKIKDMPNLYHKYRGDDILIRNFNCTVKTMPGDVGMYSVLNDENRIKGHCLPSFSFDIVKNGIPEKIFGFDLYRREVDQAETDFEKAASQVYPILQNSNLPNGSNHRAADTSGSVSFGKTYLYKIRAFLQDMSYIDSALCEVTILPPFSYTLEYPKNHKTLQSAPSKFTFKLNKDWDMPIEYFDFGLMVSNYESKMIFLSKYRYWYNYKESGLPELEIGIKGFSSNENFKTIKQLKNEGITDSSDISDFVVIDKNSSSISILPKAFNKVEFNFARRSPLQFKEGQPYSWEICSFAGSSFELQPISFSALKNSDKSTSASYGANLLRGNFSENGMFNFSLSNTGNAAGLISGNAYNDLYIVKASKNFDFSSINIKADVQNSLSMCDDESYYLVKIKDDDGLNKLLHTKGIISAEPDYEVKLIEPIQTEPDKLFSLSFKNTAPYTKDPITEAGGYSHAVTKALQAYKEFGYGEHKVLAGIIDSGVRKDHEDFLYDNNKTVVFFTDTAHITDDDIGHGTHAAGIIAAAGNNGKGVAGAAWKNTELAVYKAFGSGVGDVWSAYAALVHFTDYVKNERQSGRLVQNTVPVNMSFGVKQSSMLSLEAVNRALANGVLPIAASGNDGMNLMNYPAAYSGVLAIGSSDGRDCVSEFSNGGRHISICAPGSGIISTGNMFTDDYVYKSGTSMAAPFVTGTIAYLLSFNKNLTPSQIKTLLEDTADKIEGEENFNERRGFGRLNVYEACRKLHSNKWEAPANRFFEKCLIITVTENGNSVIGEPVFLYDSNDVCIAALKTASDGTVKIRGLAFGKYTAKANPNGKGLITANVEIESSQKLDVFAELKR